MNSLVDDPKVRTLLADLHARSAAQEAELEPHLATVGYPTGFEDEGSPSRLFWRDKFVAIEPDKARFVYAVARAGGARQVVEAGTAFGVSTIYLAAAVHDNGGGLVTTCDFEADKVEVARRHLAEAGLADLVDARVGDVLDQFAMLDGPIDLLLLDIWAPVAGEVLKLVGPRIRTGGVVIADNTDRRDRYRELMAFLDDPANGFTTQTVPFAGGLELAVRTG